MSALVKSVNQKVAEIHLERNRNVNLRQRQQKFKIKVVDWQTDNKRLYYNRYNEESPMLLDQKQTDPEPNN